MAKKPTVTTVASGYYGRQALNDNFEALRDAFDNTLSRDGSTPNAMGADFDMNGYRVLNAGQIDTDALYLNGVAVRSATDVEFQTTYLTASYTGNGSTVAYSLTANPQSEGNVSIYIDGVYQNKDTFSLSGTTITFSEAPPLNSAIEIVYPSNTDTVNGSVASAITYNQGSTGAQDRTVKQKLQEFVSVKDFGAVGDGVTDDTAAIQAALNSGAKKVFVPSGEYKVTDELTVPNYTTVIGEGEASYINGNGISAGTAPDQKSVFKCGPAINSAYASNPTLTSNVTVAANQISVDQTTNVSVGDIIALANNVTYSSGSSNVEGDPGEQVEYFVVTAKTSTTISLDRPTTFLYKTSSPAATITNYVRNEQVCLENMKISTDANYVLGFEASQLHKGRFKNLTIDTNNKSRAIELRRSIDCEIDSCTTENTGGSAAIWLAYWSTLCKITNNTTRLHDVGVTGDCAILVYYGCNRNVISNNVVSSYRQSQIWGIIVHTKSYGNTVTGNTISAAYVGVGTIYGSFGNTISSNAITSCLSGIRTENSRNIIVSNNSIVSCGNGSDNTTAGIMVLGCFDCSYVNNNIMDALYFGINVYNTANKRLNISGNSITNSAQTGIIATAASENSIVSNNIVYSPADDGIYFGADWTASVVSGNQVTNAANDGIQFYAGSTKIRCVNNTVRDCGGNGIVLGTGGETAESYFKDNICIDNGAYGIKLTNGPMNTVVDNILTGNTSGRIDNAYTSTPNTTTLADTNFMVYNEPADPTLAKTVLGWRRKDATTTGTAAWRVVNVSET